MSKAKRDVSKGQHAVMVYVTSNIVETIDERLNDLKVSAPVKRLINEYHTIFSEELRGLPPTRKVAHTIPLEPGAKPPFRPMYRMSPAELQEVERQIKELLAHDLIEPSSSPFGAPVLFVTKADGSLRMCIDYRALNKVTVKNKYPLPRIDQLLDRLHGATVFSSLDLQSGYHQIRIQPEDVPKSAFRTPYGHYQFKVLSFGLTNAPATFQAVMNDIFRDYLNEFVVVYLDDILVFSKNKAEHLKHLEIVFRILKEHELYAKCNGEPRATPFPFARDTWCTAYGGRRWAHYFYRDLAPEEGAGLAPEFLPCGAVNAPATNPGVPPATNPGDAPVYIPGVSPATNPGPSLSPDPGAPGPSRLRTRRQTPSPDPDPSEYDEEEEDDPEPTRVDQLEQRNRELVAALAQRNAALSSVQQRLDTLEGNVAAAQNTVAALRREVGGPSRPGPSAPAPTDHGGQSSVPTTNCLWCGLDGHWVPDCPKKAAGLTPEQAQRELGTLTLVRKLKEARAAQKAAKRPASGSGKKGGSSSRDGGGSGKRGRPGPGGGPGPGATHSFISADFVAANNLPVLKYAIERTWLLADNGSLSCNGFVSVPLSLPGHDARCKLTVMPRFVKGYDVLLGDDWLFANQATLSYEHKTLSLARPGEPAVQLPCHSAVPPAAVPAIKQPMVTPPPAFLISAMKATVPMATAKVAARWLRKGGRAVVAVISPDGSATPEPEVTPHGLPDAIKAQLDSLLAEYSDVFTPLTGLPPERPVGHTIPLEPGNRPPATPMYRLSKPEHDELKQQIQDLLAKGMIEPSSSPYAAPVLFVQKKSGELRMCIDYRQLNKITLRDQYPLPRIDDLFDKLSGCKVFSSLDLQAGYHQIRITPEDVPKTAFRTPEGHFQFKVLCFGLTNAPATFQRVMNDAFATVLGKCALVYLDDILVMSRSVQDHLLHLKQVFELLRKNKLYAKLSKCEFMRYTLKFLGHLVTSGGIAVDPDKVSTIANWPIPQSLQGLQSFLGAANYVRKFVCNFSNIAAPLTNLCGKGGLSFPWHDWPEVPLTAFNALKAAIAAVPMLRLPDHTKPFQVYCDASLQGLGAVLMQDGYPLAYLSRKLSPAEINYTTGEQEFLSLVTACKEWRCYLEGVPFTLFTDHQPLVALPTQKVLSRRQARWMEFMSRFSYSLVHIAGTVNPADPLSRIVHDSPESASVCAVTTRRQAKLSLEGGEAREAGLRAAAPAAIAAKSPLALSQFEKDTTCVEAMLDPIGSETPVTQIETAQYPAAPAAPMGLSDQLTLGYQQDPAFTAEADHSGMYQDTDGLWRISGKDLVVVPNVPELREHILHEMHDAAYAGHVGMTKTLERVTRVFWWNTVRADVRDYVGTCDACQRDKSSNSKPGGLLRPLTVPGYRWEHVSMDLVTKLPTGTHGYDAICVIVDRLSKMVHFVPCKEAMNAMAFTRLFINNVFRYKRHADTGLKDVEFEVGAQVLLSTRNLRIKTGKVRKFVPRYVGPFVVEAKINANAYRLTLPANMSRLHPVFHVSLLKKYSGSDVGIMPPPVEWMDETPVYYVERLLDHRYVRAGKAGEFLVQWEGYDASFNTWEPRANLTGCDKLLAEYNAIHCLKMFIQGFAKLVEPLTNLTKKDVTWCWDDKCEEAFQGVKHALSNAPVLSLPDFNKEFQVLCDASVTGIGAVLMQDKHPIAYESRRLLPAEVNYTTGKINVADPLSRYPPVRVTALLMAVTRSGTGNAKPTQQPIPAEVVKKPKPKRPAKKKVTFEVTHTELRNPQTPDDTYNVLLTIQEGYKQDPWFEDDHNTQNLRLSDSGIWYRDKQVVVPDVPGLRKGILYELHNATTSGHGGLEKTFQAVASHFWWPGMHAFVTAYVRGCQVCQRNKSSTKKPAGLLQPLPVPEYPWDSVSMDFVVKLPKSEAGNDSILVVVDRLTKMVHLMAMTEKSGGIQVAKLFFDNVFKLHGMPRTIISDRDTRFQGEFFKGLMKIMQSKQCMSTAFHPQTDGQTERVNKVMEDMLRHYVGAEFNDWDQFLAPIEFAINNSFHTSIRTTPFRLNSGFDPRLPLTLDLESTANESARDFTKVIYSNLEKAKQAIHAARHRQKAYYDMNHTDAKFQVGDQVLLSTKHLRFKNPGSPKLLPLYIGPMPITAKINEVAYRVKLPDGFKIHDVFHVSKLKLHRDGPGMILPPPPLDLGDGQWFLVERILKHRTVKGRVEYLVRWAGYGPEHDLWEPAKNISKDLIKEYKGTLIPTPEII
ncbi:hypothetical protein QJQ45_007586 [Haematococcus lacustris]|nr:hypothetical protein QJQ45_007586 [Haematococcus lacustris]